MINYDEIEKSINDLENGPLNYSVCEKLAWLYVVRDHARNKSSCLTCECDGDEFLEAVQGKDVEHIFSVLKEHMCVLKCAYPKEYEMILKRLKNS